MTKIQMKQTSILILSILICLAAGAFGSLFTVHAIPTWYAGLVKPALNPPNWVFGPVWTLLYILMGISLYLVWRNDWRVRNSLFVSHRQAWNQWSQRFWTGDLQKQNIIAIFVIQLILNAAWSYIFFGLHQVGWALFELLALWCAVVYTIINFYRVSKTSAWLLLPYILWITFAIYLNYSILSTNL